jgi:tRNA-2-methylthio-N6-dimethylallyladenosine synthase
VTVLLTQAAPHHLLADGVDGGSAIRALRRLRSGDAWEARQGMPAQAAPAVALGMPSVGVPVPLPAAPACS